ncbi:MAG: DUF6869 domain-containing protein [Polyangia bacterium]
MTQKAERASLVVAYWHDYITRHVQRDKIEADRWFWAWEAVDAIVHDDPEAALWLTVELAEYCVSAQALAYLGAGPVEDLVKTADDALFARILKAARKRPRFRRALATIWIHDETRIRALKLLFRECPPELPAGVLEDARGP